MYFSFVVVIMKLVLTWLNPPLVGRGRGQARGWYEVLFIIAWGWVTWPGQGGDTAAGGHGAVGTCWGGGGAGCCIDQTWIKNSLCDFFICECEFCIVILRSATFVVQYKTFLLSGRNVTCIDFLNVRVLFRLSKGYRYSVVVVWCRFDVGCMKNQCRTYAR